MKIKDVYIGKVYRYPDIFCSSLLKLGKWNLDRNAEQQKAPALCAGQQ